MRGVVRIFPALILSMIMLWGARLGQAQAVAGNDGIVPNLVRFNGSLTDSSGKPLSGVVGVTFALYKDEQGGAPLWLETQNVVADKNGNYTVALGASSSAGLPPDIFVAGEARWLGVRPSGQGEQARILLLSVPYALKAGDAQTLGGLPPSAFVLAAPANAGATMNTGNASTIPAASVAPATASSVTTAGGIVNRLAKFDGTADITSSRIFDNGTRVGIGNTSPAATLDVSGTGIFRGSLQLPSTGTANATTKGYNSQPFDFLASAFNGTSAVNQRFRWQAEPVNAGTSTAAGKLNLLFASGTATPAETGLSISKSGIITFAKGQTFPTVTGNETVNGQVTVNNTTNSGNAIVATGGNIGVYSTGSTGVEGISGTTGYGVYGDNSGGGTGVYGVSFGGTNGFSSGMVGTTYNAGAGVEGFTNATLSSIGSSHNNASFSSGIWADNSNSNSGSPSTSQALLATADDAFSINAVNNSLGSPTIFAVQNGSGAAIEANSVAGIGISAYGGGGTSLTWGSLSSLTNDQGGSIELGASNNLVPSQASSPYIDFHYGVDGKTAQDYNVRIINDADARLTIIGNTQFGHKPTLNVQGIVNATQGFNGQCLSNTYFLSSASSSCNMDLAEAYATSEPTEAGDVVSLAPSADATVRKSTRQYDSMLLGVVSSNPGLVFDQGKTHLAGDNTRWTTKDKAVIALAGRVPVKVSMENGAIQIGDPLTSSSQLGVAMKATQAAKIIGYALEPAHQDGKVLTFIEPGYYAAPELATLRSALSRVERENAALRTQLTSVLAQVREIEGRVDRAHSRLTKVSTKQN